MVNGPTVLGSLRDSEPTIIDSARIIREFEGVMTRLAEKHDKSKNQGSTWNESSLSALTAANVTELTMNENFQQLQDTLLSITPTYVQVVTQITDRAKARVSSNVAALIGVLAQNAMQRKKDQDLLTVVQAASTDLGSSGSPMTFGQIRAAVARIGGNDNEPAITAIYTVLQSFGIKDIQDEIVAGLGTYSIPAGLTEQTFRKGFAGTVTGSEVFRDDNIARTATPDSVGATFAKESLVFVDGLGPRVETERMPRKGGGSDIVTLTDEYGIGERSASNWMYAHTHDTTVPTS